MKRLLNRLGELRERNASNPIPLTGLRWMFGFLGIIQLIILLVVEVWPERAGGLGPLAFFSMALLFGAWADVHERLVRGRRQTVDADAPVLDIHAPERRTKE